VLRAFQNEKNEDVRLKALYCISGAVRNNQNNFQFLVDSNGFELLSNSFSDGNSNLITRCLFFFTALLREPLSESETAARILNSGMLDITLQILKSHQIDENCAEQGLHFLKALLDTKREHLYHDEIKSVLEELENRYKDEFFQDLLKECKESSLK
jgi:hypothetical protein